jgi:amphi-Trp domain-containing protein
MGEKRDRDVEKVYSTSEFVAKLRRLADALEVGERFEIQVAGERVYVPARAEFNVEHEREGMRKRSSSNSSGPTPREFFLHVPAVPYPLRGLLEPWVWHSHHLMHPTS